MLNHRRHRPAESSLALWIGLFGLALLAGCREQAEIRSYSSPKQEAVFAKNHLEGAEQPAQPTEPQDRMLAAIIPQEEKAWFFKLTGSLAAVAEIADPFRTFLSSVQFKDGAPSWDAPADWQERPASQMRHATLLVPTKSGVLELAVSSLGYQAEDHEEFLLANVNRWRRQMSLAPLSLIELPQSVEELDIRGAQATLVDLKGNFSTGSMRPPMAGQTELPRPAPSPTPTAKPQVEYDAPADWKILPASGFRKAAFEVTEGDQKAEITIIDLAATAGELLPNVNRWRGQVNLEAIDEAQLAKDAQPIAGEGWDGKYLVLAGPESDENRQTILGVVTVVGDRSWFIKLTGPAELAEQQRKAFEEFARSVKFPTN